MKGVVLAGGLGSRMYPLTKVTNKHLLPVYNEPMIYYPIKILVNAGVDDIMIVTGGNNAGEFLKLLGNGADFGLRHLNYTYQEGEGGIAAALSLAEFFADEGKIVVVLGDNIIEKNVRKAVQAFEKQKDGARIMLKEVSDPKRFGVPVFEGDRIVRVEEKPAAPKSQYAVIGIYMYDRRVFDFIKNLKPSKRGELEITDVNNFYIDEGKMEWDILDGWWSDAGTFESLQYAGNMVAKTGANKM
jgi:glucose-1-phosphate thymidylyltransferase